MIRKAIDDPEITLGNFRNKNVVKPLVVFIKKWNELVDIMNGRGEYYCRKNGRNMQEKLLDHLYWLSNWKLDHDARVEKGERDEYNFFADETWKCMQMLLLSHVVLIHYWCIERDMSINPHVLNTDPVEHHFGNCRQMVGGSTQGLTVQQIGFGDTKTGLAKSANYHNVGNNRLAGQHHQKKNKKKF